MCPPISLAVTLCVLSPITVALFSPSHLDHLRPKVSPQSGVLGPSPCRGLPFLSEPKRGVGRPMLGFGEGGVGLHRWAQLCDGHQWHSTHSKPRSCARHRRTGWQRWQPQAQDAPKAQSHRCRHHQYCTAKPCHHSTDSTLQPKWPLLTQCRWWVNWDSMNNNNNNNRLTLYRAFQAT